ncbi:uncharacterized protein RHOBADRAFT_35682, partial [Rhodotorula graminis WP1]
MHVVDLDLAERETRSEPGRRDLGAATKARRRASSTSSTSLAAALSNDGAACRAAEETPRAAHGRRCAPPSRCVVPARSHLPLLPHSPPRTTPPWLARPGARVHQVQCTRLTHLSPLHPAPVPLPLTPHRSPSLISSSFPLLVHATEALGIVTHDISLYDHKLCHPFVAGICPHDLFTNTKMDLGTCAKTHSIKLKNEYEGMLKKAEQDKDEDKIKMLNSFKMNYEQVIMGFVGECDRRIAAAHRRLEKTPEENNRTTALMREVGEIEGAYQAAMAEVEMLGSQGKVEESMTQLTKAEALKAEKLDKERELQQLTDTAGASGNQKLRVCDICGAYLSILDSDRRLADHFGGKMHLGYHQLRQLIDEWK